ncbi:hypothetical protein D9611_006396 [Ephemerocybe angulata]|uniref:Uncharacterized protein n=1 Tax=Ephemerocybe angulata TaxID=980116 RepID=A0A8H5C6M1_9AGAR|nr:hypothetical protein D9611_006396 [Tulosesus angulatus]
MRILAAKKVPTLAIRLQAEVRRHQRMRIRTHVKKRLEVQSAVNAVSLPANHPNTCDTPIGERQRRRLVASQKRLDLRSRPQQLFTHNTRDTTDRPIEGCRPPPSSHVHRLGLMLAMSKPTKLAQNSPSLARHSPPIQRHRQIEEANGCAWFDVSHDEIDEADPLLTFRTSSSRHLVHRRVRPNLPRPSRGGGSPSPARIEFEHVLAIEGRQHHPSTVHRNSSAIGNLRKRRFQILLVVSTRRVQDSQGA